MKKIVWEVQYTAPPAAVRYCKTCGRKTEYISSGFFRVNAQKKALDIWLIYKCAGCGNTWNLTLYSRVNPRKFDIETLERFHKNDSGLAMQYAMNTELLKKNGAETTLPEYRINGAELDFQSAGELHICGQYPSQIKVSAILREKLRLSQNQFHTLLENGVLKSVSGQDLKKCRLMKEINLYWEPL